jgi:hypothetical protein
MPVLSLCQIQRGGSLGLGLGSAVVVVVVVVVLVGVNAHLRLVLNILIFLPSGRVIWIDDALSLPVRTVQTGVFAAALVTARSGRRKMDRDW